MKVQKYLPPQERPAPEKQLQDVASMYEKHFLREMLKSMRSTVQESGFIQTNHAEKIFRGQLDDQYVEKWGEKGGIGLSKLIYDQLIEKFGVQLGIKSPESPLKGPIQVKTQDQDNRQILRKHERSSFEVSFGPEARIEDRKVLAPWDGQVLQKIELKPDQHLLEIAHRNGLKSQLYYQGRVSQIEIGTEVQAGEQLGMISPDSNKLIWNVSKNLSELQSDRTGLNNSAVVSE